MEIWKISLLTGKLTANGDVFNSYVSHCQRVSLSFPMGLAQTTTGHHYHLRCPYKQGINWAQPPPPKQLGRTSFLPRRRKDLCEMPAALGGYTLHGWILQNLWKWSRNIHENAPLARGQPMFEAQPKLRLKRRRSQADLTMSPLFWHPNSIVPKFPCFVWSSNKHDWLLIASVFLNSSKFDWRDDHPQNYIYW